MLEGICCAVQFLRASASVWLKSVDQRRPELQTEGCCAHSCGQAGSIEALLISGFGPAERGCNVIMLRFPLTSVVSWCMHIQHALCTLSLAASASKSLLDAYILVTRMVWVALYGTSHLFHTGQVLLPVHACSFAPLFPAAYSTPAGTALTLGSFSSRG